MELIFGCQCPLTSCCLNQSPGANFSILLWLTPDYFTLVNARLFHSSQGEIAVAMELNTNCGCVCDSLRIQIFKERGTSPKTARCLHTRHQTLATDTELASMGTNKGLESRLDMRDNH